MADNIIKLIKDKNDSVAKTKVNAEEKTELQKIDKQKSLDKELYKNVGKLCGGDSEAFGEMIINQLSSTSTSATDIACALDNIKSIAPKDHIEGMLATQMITTHNTAMKFFSRTNLLLEAASRESTVNLANDTLKLADKLTRTYALQMEALSRYRNKGKQKMTVEHVHVNAGGQAIIGDVSSNKGIKEE